MISFIELFIRDETQSRPKWIFLRKQTQASRDDQLRGQHICNTNMFLRT